MHVSTRYLSENSNIIVSRLTWWQIHHFKSGWNCKKVPQYILVPFRYSSFNYGGCQQVIKGNPLKEWLSNFSCIRITWGACKEISGLHSQNFWLNWFEGKTRIFIPDKFLGDADSATWSRDLNLRIIVLRYLMKRKWGMYSLTYSLVHFGIRIILDDK